MKKFTAAETRDLFGQVVMGEISLSRMVEILNEMVKETNETQYKDGEFVVNEVGDVLIFKKKEWDLIYDHAYLQKRGILLMKPNLETTFSIKRLVTKEEKQKLLDALSKEGKRWNEEKKCIEYIPVRKFKVGDKVRIKHGISSETVHGQDPVFQPSMDDFIGTTMTVSGYTDESGYVVCKEAGWRFHEEWLEPYADELKEGNLAIFWDYSKECALVRIYMGKDGVLHCDGAGVLWQNAIKFESKEQFNRLINGEI